MRATGIRLPEERALFELSKFAAAEVATEQQRWLKFFVEGERLDPAHLPVWMNTPEMHQAMSTVQDFSEKERAYHAYHAYQARQNYLRQQKTIQRRIDELTAEAEHAHAEIARERAEKEAALAKIARLKARLEDLDH